MQKVYVSVFMVNNTIRCHVNDTLDNAKAGWITTFQKVGTPEFRINVEEDRWAVTCPKNSHVGYIEEKTVYNYGEHL